MLEELIEAKVIDEDISRSLLYYAQRLKSSGAIQVVDRLRRPYDKNGVRVTDPLSFSRAFP